MTATGMQAAGAQPAELPSPGPLPARTDPSATGGRPPASHRVRALLMAGGAYLVLALLLWWNVWTSHPTSITTCGCGDSSLFTWFIEWPAYAIAHGLSPFFTTAVGFPGGVNLPANTSVLAIGVVLAPVTWLFGPVASMNVALTLAPALSATAMFVLLQRWVSWAPASFFGGLFYGFSPFVLVSLADAHLMLGMAFVPPLVVACLDELLVRRRRRPVATGVLLGLLIVVQFFIGTEVLLIMAVTAGIGIVMVAVYAALSHPAVLRQAARHVAVGFGAAVLTAGVLLAYPTWFALAGPAHLSGLVWPPHYAGYEGNAVRNFLVPTPALSTGFFGSAMSRVVGGSQGPILSSQYVGIGAVAVVVIGTVIWRRDRRLWLFGAVALVSAVLSLGARHRSFLPWQFFAHLPLFENITPGRFVLMTYLAVAVSSGVIIDHCRTAVARRRHPARHARAERSPGVWRRLSGGGGGHDGGRSGAGPVRRLPLGQPSLHDPAGAASHLAQDGGTPTARTTGAAHPPRPLRRDPDGHDLAGRRPDGLLDGRPGWARRCAGPGRDRARRSVRHRQRDLLLQPHPGHHRPGCGGHAAGPARMGGHRGGRPRSARTAGLRADPIGDRRRRR